MSGTKLFGRPDGVDTEHGALLPVEIKSHKTVQPTDKLELALYWLLLAPYRTRRVREPRGVLFLKEHAEKRGFTASVLSSWKTGKARPPVDAIDASLDLHRTGRVLRS